MPLLEAELWFTIYKVKVNRILAPGDDGGEDGEGEEEHRTVDADLLVASHLLHNSITFERMVFDFNNWKYNVVLIMCENIHADIDEKNDKEDDISTYILLIWICKKMVN